MSSPTASQHDALVMDPKAHLNELKALLSKNKNLVPEFSLTPCRTVTWSGEQIAYKNRPLLADDKGCLTIRLAEAEVEELVAHAASDPELQLLTTPTRLFSRPSIPIYHLSLSPHTPITTPMGSPVLKVHTLPRMNSEPRITPDWMENEGFVTAEEEKWMGKGNGVGQGGLDLEGLVMGLKGEGGEGKGDSVLGWKVGGEGVAIEV